MIVCAFLAESAGPGSLELGNGRHPYCTRCAWKADLFSEPEGYAQDPCGRIGLRFVGEYYVHRPFHCLRPYSGMPKSLDLKGQLKSMPWHSRGCEKFDAIQHHGDFSHPLFRFYSPRSLGATSGPASRRPRGRQLSLAMSPRQSPSPVLRFPRAQGWITSRGPSAKGLTPVLRRRVGLAVQGRIPPLPAGGSTGRARHIAAAEFGGLASAVAVPELSLVQQGVAAPYRIRADRVHNQIETVIHCSLL